MKKHDKKKKENQSNPFAENMDNNLSEETLVDNNVNEDIDLESASQNTEEDDEDLVEIINNDDEEEDNVTSQEHVVEEKKGLFDGLFKKSDEELKKLKEAYEILNNQYLRLAADFDNYRKRQEAEREGLIKFGTEQALKKMIEIADNFERAEKSLTGVDDCEKAKEAFNVLNKQFKSSLSKLGLEEIKAEGEKFDPNFHEAVMQVPTDEHPEETVIQEMQKGYKYGDKVLRPSMVSVAVSN